ncbi:MAG TPA: NAD-dependent epimerase/dehydratase family protein [Stenomitos sp.]
MSRPLLITGASGFLGRHVLEALAQGSDADWQPVALVRNAVEWGLTAWQQALGPVPAVAGELLDAAAWEDHPLLEGLGGILHLAAVVKHSRTSPEAMVRTNVEGTLAMVRLAAKYRCRLVFVSTSGTVGCFMRPDQQADEAAPYCWEQVKEWPYYRSKIEAELAARTLASELGVELVIIRPPVILGPQDHRLRSTSNVARVLRRRVPFMLEGGMHFVDVRDVAPALLRALEIPTPRPVYHLPGCQSTLPVFFRMVARLAQVPLPGWSVPNGLVWALASLNQALGPHALHLLPDPVVIEMASRHWGLRSLYAEAELGYRARPADETLRDTVTWLRDHYGLASSRTREPEPVG